MTSEDLVSKLPPRVRELVQRSTKQGAVVAEQAKDEAQVADWISKISIGELVKVQHLAELESELTTRTYLVSNQLSTADVALYAALHPVVAELKDGVFSFPSITRYFDNLQRRPPIRSIAESVSPPFSIIAIDVDKAPKIERKQEPPKKKAPKTTAISTDANPSPEAAATSAAPAKEKAIKAQESNADAGKGKSKPSSVVGGKKSIKAVTDAKKSTTTGQPEASDDSGVPVPSMIDLRVGHIVAVEKHPDADTLYVEQIDIGEPNGPRTVVSGLVKYVPIEDMRDRDLIVVCNLKPANMRGIKSQAMVLCASSANKEKIELLLPPKGSKPGDRVYFEGEEYEGSQPLPQLNPKKKIFETIQPGFITLDTREAAWVDPNTKSIHRIRTKDGHVLAPTLIGASLS